MRCFSLRNGCSHLNYISFLNCFISPQNDQLFISKFFVQRMSLCFMEVSWQRRHPTAGFCFAFINMESKAWIFLRQNWKAYLGLKLLPSKCTMLVEKSWISKFSIAEIFFWQETADFYQISISISSGPVRSRCRPDIIVQAKGIAPFVAYNMADLHVRTIRPNFSGSHTFSLTATTARWNVIYKAKRKLHPISG